MELFKGTQDVGFTDGRKIALFEVFSPLAAGFGIHQGQHPGLQHEIAPDTAIDIAGNHRHRFIYWLHQPAVKGMALSHRPMLRHITTDAGG